MSLSWQDFQACAQDFAARSQRLHDSWELIRKTERIGGWYLRKAGVQVRAQHPTTRHADIIELSDSAAEEGAEGDGLEDLALIDDDNADDGVLQDVGFTPPWRQYEYHIVYSPAYSVPVLYFRARHLDGRQLRLHEVMSDIDAFDRDRMPTTGTGVAITQAEHPILGQPFYQLHPCRTAAVMSQLLRSPDTSSTSATLSDAVERITRQRSRENQEATALGGESNENDIAEVACTGQGGSQEIVAVGDACRDNYLVAWASAMGRVVGLHLPAEYALAVDDTIGI